MNAMMICTSFSKKNKHPYFLQEISRSIFRIDGNIYVVNKITIKSKIKNGFVPSSREPEMRISLNGEFVESLECYHTSNEFMGGLTELRKIPYITGGFQYRIEPYVAYASTDICLKLLEADIVGFAEPVIISTSEDD